MTFDEWRDALIHDLRKAGFTVEIRSGFPFVPADSTRSAESALALLSFEAAVPLCVSFYREGVLFTPEWPARLNVA